MSIVESASLPPIRGMRLRCGDLPTMWSIASSHVKITTTMRRGGADEPRTASGVLLDTWTFVVLTVGHVLRPQRGEELVASEVIADGRGVSVRAGVEAAVWFESDDPRYDLGAVALACDLVHEERLLLQRPSSAPFAATLHGFATGEEQARTVRTRLVPESGLYDYADEPDADGMSGGAVTTDAANVAALHLGRTPGHARQCAVPLHLELVDALTAALTRVWGA